MFYSYDEVFSQGRELKETFDYVLSQKDAITRLIDAGGYDEIVFIACGSSYWMSMSACMTFQELLDIRCSAIKSGDVILNKEYYSKAFSKPLVIAPSRSGMTSETIIAVKLFKESYGSNVISIVEYPKSPMHDLSDASLFIPWANETSVCQTRSFSNLYLASLLIASFSSENNELIEDLNAYINEFDVHSKKAEAQIREIINRFHRWGSLVTLGNGKQYGVCIEGAYISLEMAQFPSYYYGVLEYRHGPIVMADDSYLVCIFSGGNGKAHEEKMAGEIQAKGAKVVSISDIGGFKNADYDFNLGRKALPETVALYGIMVMQGFAHLKAVNLGIDPDSPKELVPWIKI
jgi:glucosamine--fructose-6-phosphate aminotransferase (isomerizing)